MATRLGEIIMGLGVAVLATLLYALRHDAATSWASSPLGHGLGIVGVLLMLWAGFGYTWRKHQEAGGSVSMATAMVWHMAAGLLGPYLVLLHSGFVFRGLAGVLTLAMVLVVASGVVGRAVLASLPRAVTTAHPVQLAMLDSELARVEAALAEVARREPPDAAREAVLHAELMALRHEQEGVRRDIAQPAPIAAVRAVLSVWWMLHVPMSAALWVLAAAHIVASVYFTLFTR
ncbi:MAG: hypothetical protein K2R93_09050 [Gemmatimonadaceae bacterium]|nr:hypothetical protein [Gemmatimonadaceae bacterium]